jgi:hypothetical protein
MISHGAHATENAVLDTPASVISDEIPYVRLRTLLETPASMISDEIPWKRFRTVCQTEPRLYLSDGSRSTEHGRRLESEHT